MGRLIRQKSADRKDERSNLPDSRRMLDAGGTRSTRLSRSNLGLFSLLILWPILYFWPYLIPNGVHPGNDFHALYYRYKAYLIDFLAQGSPIPIWSPTEAAGFPFRANPFTAAHYPFNRLLAEIYFWNGGYSECDHVCFTLLAFSLFAVGSFLWLITLGEARSGAILASLVMATSLKLSEIIRFPNAAHAAAWIPWLLFGITLACRHGYAVWAGIVCGLVSYCLVTSGYPYYAYYSQFLLGPWLLILIWPFTRRFVSNLPDESWASPQVAVTSIIAGFGVAAASCLAYLREMKQMLAATTDRRGGDWNYGTMHEWTLTDILGSLVYPPRACTEGWYFFGITAFAIIALFCWEQLSPRNKAAPNSKGFLLVTISLWLWLTLITVGKWSPLFYVLWKFVPGFSSLRVWARMNVILLPVICLLLCRSWNWWTKESAEGDAKTRNRLVSRLAAIAAGVLAVQMFLVFATSEESYWTNSFLAPNSPLAEWRRHLSWTVIVLGLVGIVLLAWMTKENKQATRFSFAAVLCLCAVETTGFGCLQWTNWRHEGHAFREYLNMPKRLRIGFDVPRTMATTTISLIPSANLGILENWYFQRYVSFLQRFAPRPDNLSAEPQQLAEVPGMLEMLGVKNGQRLFFVSQLDFETPERFVEAARDFKRQNHCHCQVQQFDGDRLRMHVTTDQTGYLCYIDNWDPTWTCSINGKPVTIELLMETFKAVSVPSGQSEVYFSCAGDMLRSN